MKSCENCHYEKITSFDMSPCFEAGGGCFNDKNKPNWTPLTNGDKVREMTDSDLVELWSVTEWDDKYLPECANDETIGCAYVNFTCKGCPLTFGNWLKDVSEP